MQIVYGTSLPSCKEGFVPVSLFHSPDPIARTKSRLVRFCCAIGNVTIVICDKHWYFVRKVTTPTELPPEPIHQKPFFAPFGYEYNRVIPFIEISFTNQLAPFILIAAEDWQPPSLVTLSLAYPSFPKLSPRAGG